jgi:hypothetical protein
MGHVTDNPEPAPAHPRRNDPSGGTLSSSLNGSAA